VCRREGGRLRAARKLKWHKQQWRRPSRLFFEDDTSSEDRSRSGSESDTGSGSRSRGRSRSASESDPDKTTAENSPEEDPPDTGADEPAETDEVILEALDSLGAPTLRMQATRRLPFLLRTLRHGFAHRCAIVGIPATPNPPAKVIKVVFRLDERCAYLGRMMGWKCPVCELHGAFENRATLGKHLEWDHGEVRVMWEETDEACSISIFVGTGDS
jgi:hypothetical protein